MGISIEVEASAGSEINETVKDMIALAAKLNVMVQGKFNGVTVLVMDGDDADDIVRSWEHEVRSKFPVKIATARGGRMLASQAQS